VKAHTSVQGKEPIKYLPQDHESDWIPPKESSRLDAAMTLGNHRSAKTTRETVEYYFKNEQGLTAFLKKCWKQ
jgi:hypothetical protein